MDIKRTYGTIIHSAAEKKFIIEKAEPHVCIKLKELFKRIPKSDVCPFELADNPETAHDLHWFMLRYPMNISKEHSKIILRKRSSFINTINELESIFLPDYLPGEIVLKDGHTARKYQLSGSEIIEKAQRIFIGDDLGLGKSLTSLLPIVHNTKRIPFIIIVQAHLTTQWKETQIEKFTNLKTHIIKSRKPYSLPEADAYIITYSKLSGWVDVFEKRFFKYAIFDEAQELRHPDTEKYKAAKVLSNHVKSCVGLSATPIYNFADEVYNVMDVIKPGCLGERWSFLREWTTNFKVVTDPKALGTYLRENFIFIRRTRAEVGRELPRLNKIVYTVGYDHKAVEEVHSIANALALKVMHGTFTERGSAARELDIYVRHETGVSKARDVAGFVKILLDNNEPVILAGWHRDVYEIWMEELKDYNPVMFTGSESIKQKNDAREKFMTGETNLFIMSLRSGAGIDGLQYRCKTIVVGELDYSPKVHDQLIGRVDRDGQEEEVTAYFLTSDFGSDPLIINLLGLKSSQSEGILNPLITASEQYSDESRIKMLAELFINKNQHHVKLLED